MYCVKCRVKREGRGHQMVLVRDGKRKAIKAVCEVCGTSIYKLLSKDEQSV